MKSGAELWRAAWTVLHRLSLRGRQYLLHDGFAAGCDSYAWNSLNRRNVAQGDRLEMCDEIRPAQLEYYAVDQIPVPKIFEAPAVERFARILKHGPI